MTPTLWLPEWMQRLRAPIEARRRSPSGGRYRNGSGQRIHATDEELEECCCGETTIEDCDGLATCLEVVDGLHTVEAAVTLSGMADGTCSSCESLDDTYVLPPAIWDVTSDVCVATWGESLHPVTCFTNTYNIAFSITDFDPGNTSACQIVLLIVAAEGAEEDSVAWTLYGTDAFDAVSTLCAGTPLVLDLEDEIATRCDWPATITVQLV